MLQELAKEKWSGKINTIEVGALSQDGGSRSCVVRVGGQTTLPFVFDEGGIPHRPVIAAEITDCPPADWPDELNKSLQDVYADPFAWAKKMIDKTRVDMLCVNLQSIHPEMDNRGPDQAAAFLKKLFEAVKVPMIIRGCGDAQKDNAVLPVCAQALKGEKCLFGNATQENYKTLVAACVADGHSIVAESPIDINIAKQLNILITDMGINMDKIVIDPTVGSLGYGLEYTYSIMERARLAALTGDKMMASPFICYVAAETWRVKEAKASAKEIPQWGDEAKRGVAWEAITASTLLLSGADILVMRHPEAITAVRDRIDALMKS